MRVSLYTESFKPYLSGVTVSVDTFATGLTKLGHDVTVFAPEYPGFVETDSYKVFRFPSLGASFYPGFRLALPFSKKHKKYFLENKPDIIHSHSPYQLGYLSQYIAQKNQIPFVYHFHTLFTEYLHFMPIPHFISRPLVINIVRNFCKKCDLIIAPTPIIKDVLQKQYGIKQPIEILPTAVDEDAVAKASPQGIREKYNIPDKTILLEYCGRLSKEKNIEFLLQAFQKINNAEPNTKLMIVAFGPQEAELKTLAQKLQLSDKVIFTGRIERAQVYNYLKAGDIFVCASKTETQGLVLSEAKACGKPAVAIKAQGVAYMVEDGVDGYLTNDDLEEFVQKTLSLVRDPKQREVFAQNALRIAQEKYTISAITKKLEKLYNNLVKS